MPWLKLAAYLFKVLIPLVKIARISEFLEMIMHRSLYAPLSMLRDNRVAPYSFALFAVAAGMILRLFLEWYFGSILPTYITFYPMIMAVAMLGGFRPSVVAIVITIIVVDNWIIPLTEQFSIDKPIDLARFEMFIVTCLLMSVISELCWYIRRKIAASEREQWLLTMANEMPQLAWRAGPDGYIFWYNSRWYEYTGTMPEQMKGWGWRDVHDPVKLPAVIKCWNASIATGESFEMTVHLRSADGRFRRFLSRAFALRDTSGHIVQWFGTCTDIEEISLAMEAIRKSEERWKYALEVSEFGAWELNLVDLTVWHSLRHDQIFGYSSLLPTWTYELFLLHVLDDDRAFVDDCFQSARTKGRNWNFECRIRRADGQVCWILAYGKNISDADGRPISMFGLIADITKRKNIEEKVAQSEALYRGIGESIDYGVWVCDSTGHNIYASQNFLNIVGITQQQWSISGWSNVLHPDDGAATIAAWQECVRTGGTWNREHSFQGTDGGQHSILTRGLPIKDESGKIVYWAGINLDITNLKKTEENLRVAMETAESANKAKSRFLAAASHDLRQPLAALCIYSEMLATKVASSDQNIVKNMKTSLDGLNNLLTDLLDFSKLSAGVIETNVENFYIERLFENLRCVYQPVAALKDLRLRYVSTKSVVYTDPILLQRILSNFVDNALRFTTRGGVVMGCRRRHDKVFIEVWDSGIGIPAEKKTEIFEEFKQLGDQARNNGSGLGLAITAKVATLLGLTIQVRSVPGRGSVFTVVVPIGQIKTLPIPIIAQVTAGLSLRIALVEDNRLVRNAISMAMQEAGHQIVSATNADELLTALGPNPPDAVIADYRLKKGVTGFDVISVLRAKFSRDLPAIIITGDTDPALLSAMAKDKISILHKPMNLKELYTCLETNTKSESARESRR